MLVDITNPEFKRLLPLFFLNEVGPSLFYTQKLGILPTIPNLTRYYSSVIVKSIQEDLVLGWMENNEIVALSFSDVLINFEFKLESKISQGNFTHVVRDYRKKGIAKELRSEMLRRLKNKGYEYSISIIDCNDQAANKSMARFTDQTKPSCNLYKVCLKDF